MSHPSALPESLGAEFSVSAGLSAGVSASRLRAKDLTAPFWGVRVRTDIAVPRPSPRGMLSAEERASLERIAHYGPRMTPHAFWSHQSAALLWGIPLPLPLDPDVHVSVLRPHRAPRGKGVHGHQLAPRGVVIREIDGMRVADPASTWLQLSQSLALRDLVAAGDALLAVPRDSFGRRLPPDAALATLAELEAATLGFAHPGRARARAALPLLRVGSSSRPESHLRLALVEAGLPEPDLDVDIHDRHGRKLGHSELVYRGLRVVVEYEGRHHLTSARQWNRDIAKYEAYAAAGWTVVRITSEHLYPHPVEAVARVTTALLASGWRP